MGERVVITSGALTATIDPLGAELVSLRDADGRELMTDADPAFWTGHAPILFPIVGEAAGGMVRVDGVGYPIRRHGFARGSTFAVADVSATRVTFRLVDSIETMAAWPFRFLLEIAFDVVGATLTTTARIGNTGDVAMPASFGFHPAFAWPLPYGGARAEHRIVFDRDEPAPLRRLDADGLIVPEPRATPVEGDTLRLRDDLFADDALIWDTLGSRGVTYGPAIGPHLRIDFPDTPMLGVWTKPGAAYVCIEPWHGIADRQGFDGEMRDKPGVFVVAPGGEKLIAMAVTLEA